MQQSTVIELADAAFAQGDLEEALGHYLVELLADPGDLLAWYRTALILAELGERQVARESLDLVAQALAESGQLLLALSAVHGLRELHEETFSARVRSLAALYGAGSPRLQRRSRSLPPPLPHKQHDQPESAARKQDPAAVRRLAAEACAATARAFKQRAQPGQERVPFHPLLSDLGPADLASLVPLMLLRTLPEGEVVIEQGDQGRSFFMLVRGAVRVCRRTREGKEVELALLGEGALFGEMALLTDSPRVAQVYCTEPTTLIEVGRREADALAARNPGVAEVLVSHTRERMLRNLMATSPLFTPLDRSRQERLIGLFRTCLYSPGEKVLQEGQPSEGLHVVLSGQVRVTRGEEGGTLALADLGPGQIFGEISMIQRRPATATVTAQYKTAVLILSREAFNDNVADYPEVLSHVYQVAVQRERANAMLERSPVIPVQEEALLI